MLTESTRSNECIKRAQVRMFNRQYPLSGSALLLPYPLSSRTCLHRGETARPRQWTQTSLALTALQPAGSTVRRATWWRTATAGWSTCLVGTCWMHILYIYIFLQIYVYSQKTYNDSYSVGLLWLEFLPFDILPTKTNLKELLFFFLCQ